MNSPVNADFSRIRYAQCWEDADVLVDALEPAPGKRVLSIASAGDNALALIARGAEVVAIDLNPAQLACLELRVAAYRRLEHHELLVLIGSMGWSVPPASRRCSGKDTGWKPGAHSDSARERVRLYEKCRDDLTDAARGFWDAHPGEVEAGIGGAGKFERYFALFRNRVMPMIHSRATVDRLLRGGSPDAQADFYRRVWDNRRWRWLFRVFFSRFVMGRLGRSPEFFAHVEGSVADRIMERTRYALTELDCSENPYLQWILKGRHTTALPFALREENFSSIRKHLPNLTWRLGSLEEVLESGAGMFDGFNLSDVFEYVDEDHSSNLLARVASRANPGARLAYWNMLAPRSRPESMRDVLEPMSERAEELFRRDKAWFYQRFVLERRLPS